MIRLLSRLSIQSPSFERTSRGTGLSYSAADVAAALATLSNPVAFPLLMAKHVGDSSMASRLAREVADMIEDKAVESNWRTIKGDEIWHLMARGVVDEYVNDKNRCKKCRGTGVRHNPQSEKRECEDCKGFGVVKPNKSERARCLGVSPPSYESTWHDRWEWAMRELTKIEVDGEREFNRQFR